MDVSVCLRERGFDGTPTKRSLWVRVNVETDTVADLLEVLSMNSCIPSNKLQVILGGLKLHPNTPIRQLHLGPTTSLLALVVERAESPRHPEVAVPPPHLIRKVVSSFFVYCKSCNGAKPAKLRVHCSGCNSTSVEVKRDPERWSDVLKSHTIPIECFECTKASLYAQFVFKCAECNEPSAALKHLRPISSAAAAATNGESVAASSPSTTAPTLPTSCCICFSEFDEATGPMVDLRCGHPLCIPCFSQMVEVGLRSAQFSLHPILGYTIACPWPTCNAVIKDPHHFAIVGSHVYSEYKARALDAFMAQESVKCPHCSIGFIWEPINDAPSLDGLVDGERPSIECPNCDKNFCAVCRREPCTCDDEEAANRVTFEASTRRCPHCSTRTERTGGCAHIRCVVCGDDWCFVCVGPWTDECQWTHWFS